MAINWKRYIINFSIVLAVLCGFVLGVVFDQYNKPSIEKIKNIINPEFDKPAEVNFSLFWDVWHKVEEKYVDRQKLDRQQMVYGAIEGLLKSLNDPYTAFMPPRETKEFNEEMKKGEFGGIGIEIGMRKEILTVVAPLEETPAHNAGLLAGDKILKIDNTITADLTLNESVKLIRGPKGTDVTLTIGRNGWTKTKEFKITRDIIRIPILKISDIEGYKYIKFYQFTENAVGEFRNAALQFLTQNPKGIILDLRNNPGGYLEVAVDIASWFLPAGKVVAIEDFGNGKKHEYKSVGYNQLNKFPLVILINQGSASASEILAGALKDQLDIKIIGEKSFGKGSVQEMEELSDGSSVKITIAKWLTPKGKSLSDDGLEPDVKIEKTEGNIENNEDPQLDKALEIIKKL